ncbi:hypothetical protein FQN57_002709 [Myotisia sp. PD_48]|nr:hypothetical protein FQN57_002709 [Myotisia sp. PD_48]
MTSLLARAMPGRYPIRVLPTIQSRRQFSSLSLPSRFLKVSEEVQDAIATRKPVVALESTIYTHGFPYPQNVNLAKSLESIVRSTGGVPATVGIIDGVARVGMNAQELSLLTSASEERTVQKVSRRDLGYICGMGIRGRPMIGGTTIAGTMILANLAGIKVFATGGLGGVHRGGESSMDISADLTELGRTPVAVISSGCKSFLDIQRTLEYLETEGVIVATFADGREGNIDFPAFFTRDSGIKSPKAIRDEKDAAAIIYAQSQLQLSSGLLFTNPIPEIHSFPKPEMDAIIAQAIELAHLEGVHGSENTPFVLAQIEELSRGRSVTANKALVENNVERGTRVAIELAKLESEYNGTVDRYMPVNAAISQSISEPSETEESISSISMADETTSKEPLLIEDRPDVLVAGALAVDLACDYTPLSTKGANISPNLHTSNPSKIHQTLGGVGHNVALAASYLGSSVMFCSMVADDISGRSALASINKDYIQTFQSQGIQILPPNAETRTAQYIAVNDAQKNLVLAMADMSILELPEPKLNFKTFWEPLLQQKESHAKWAVVDANWDSQAASKWISLCKSHGMKIALEPVSAAKASRLFRRPFASKHGHSSTSPVLKPTDIAPHNHLIDLVTPNQYELAAMHTAARENGYFESPEWWGVIDALELPSGGSTDRLVSNTNPQLVKEGIPQQSLQLAPLIPSVLTKLGSQGVLLTQIFWRDDPRLRSVDYAPYILGRSSNDSSPVGGVYMRLFPPEEILSEGDIVSVNGAGDTLLGVVMAGLGRVEGDATLEDIIPIAQKASVMTLKSEHAVNPEISQLIPLLDSLTYW